MPDRRRLGLITYHGEPGLSLDDRLLLEPLIRHGFDPFPVVWSEVDPASVDADLLIMRSAWDYYLTPVPFLAWLDAVERRGLPCFNPVSTIRWNMRKDYLLRLQHAGVSIPRTAVCETWDPAVLHPFAGSPIVVKPVVSASAHETFRFTEWTDGTIADVARPMLAMGPILVQEYVPEIERSGEWSFVFLGRTFSHAVLKSAAPADFRVQETLGGSIAHGHPDPAILEQAAGVLDLVDDDLLYARVDGVARAGTFTLMELELFEPSLFLRYHPPAAEAFASSLHRMTDDHGHRR